MAVSLKDKFKSKPMNFNGKSPWGNGTVDALKKTVASMNKPTTPSKPTAAKQNPPTWQDKMREEYNKIYDDYAKAQTEQAEQQKSANAASAEDKARQAYISNVRQQQSLQNQMARNGIVGGAAETSMVNMGNNLSTNRTAIRNNLSSTNAGIDNNLRNALLTYRATVDENFRNARATEQARRDQLVENQRRHDEWKMDFDAKQKQQKHDNKVNDKNAKHQYWANTSVYGSVAEADRAINTTKGKIHGLNNQIKSLSKKLRNTKSPKARKAIRDRINSLKNKRSDYRTKLGYQKAGRANYINSQKK